MKFPFSTFPPHEEQRALQHAFFLLGQMMYENEEEKKIK
jgi:hypothetical protein